MIHYKNEMNDHESKWYNYVNNKLWCICADRTQITNGCNYSFKFDHITYNIKYNLFIINYNKMEDSDILTLIAILSIIIIVILWFTSEGFNDKNNKKEEKENEPTPTIAINNDRPRGG